MAQWARTYGAISEVLKNGGSIWIEDLHRKLVELDPRRFRGDNIVEYIVDNLTSCLTIEGAHVKYNKRSKKYAKISMAVFERTIQQALHGSIPNMEKWQLYPYLDRKNSANCYVGIPWREIPAKKEDPQINIDCDFRINETDECHARCGVTEETLKKYGLV